MKKQWMVCLVAVVAVALALGIMASVPDASAQTPLPPTYLDQATSPPDRDMSDTVGCKASELIGMDVRSRSGDENIGSIEDLMISHNGRVEYVAVSFGGFLGMGDKLFAVPPNAIEFEKTDESGRDEAYARIDVTEQTLRNKKGFDQDNWPERADRSFLTDTPPRQAERPTASPPASPHQ